jgi:hypothetical protein
MLCVGKESPERWPCGAIARTHATGGESCIPGSGQPSASGAKDRSDGRKKGKRAVYAESSRAHPTPYSRVVHTLTHANSRTLARRFMALSMAARR